MEHLYIKNFDNYQHYKHRSMVWFKWHISCLSDYKFSKLKDRQKWLFIGLICLACKTDNKIPIDLEWIKTQISYDSSTLKEDIEILVASKMLASCKQSACLDKKRIEKKREDIESHKKQSFQIPTTEEVEKYAKSIGFAIDGERFIAHYSASGWYRGKTKIKDWRACVVTWKKTDKDKTDKQKDNW